MTSSMNATFAKQPDRSVLVEGPSAKGTYTLKFDTELATVTAIRLELLADAKLPSNGPGRGPNGNLVLSELKVTGAPKADPAKVMPLSLTRATADFSQEAFPVVGAVDGNPATGWALSPQLGKNHTAIFDVKEDVNFPGGTSLTLVVDQQYDDLHTLGKFRISVTGSKRPANSQPLPAKIAEILALAPDARNDAQKTELAQYHRSLDPTWVSLNLVVATSVEQQKSQRLTGAQDLAWALINSPSFLFNR